MFRLRHRPFDNNTKNNCNASSGHKLK